MEVELPVTDPERCREAYVNDDNVIIGDSVICAGDPYGGYDSCRVLHITDCFHFFRVSHVNNADVDLFLYSCFPWPNVLRAIPAAL